MSGVLSNDAYKNYFGNPDSNAQGAIVASMPAGSFVGAMAVGKLADILGRKWTILLAGWIWVIGSILQCAAVVSLSSSPLCLVWWRARSRRHLGARDGYWPRRR